ncbi:exocyst complex subunit 2 [Heterostelium album PN500]|uniref:Exocyst complex component 2 n=1 Tax=Heterostelium pallidum (strain ATCC 26659 / Pp 5 / PN500) TaxID=670386 RepID=D3AW71_HETP5|nr:exocyst complex subunit 2 [Heterostelium album PN500]EFA86544.1 exocyst complex subunit 2 [Heterostelium album PN500]|eukprot:XP_020438649.1 exocyst complex subunit 2 [Heterostelium album PN500]
MSSSDDSSDYDDYTDSEEDTEPISWNKLKDGWQEFLVDENAFFIVPTNDTPVVNASGGALPSTTASTPTSPTTTIQIDENAFKDPLGILKIPPRKSFNVKSHLISLESEQFDPVVFLSEIHSQTKFTELSVGLSKLKEESTSKDLEIKLLVKDNFEHFVKCKDTVDEVYTLISSSSMLQDMTGSFTKIIDKSSLVYNPLLHGKQEADRIRKVLALLNKFKLIFKLPGKIVENIKQGEFDKIIHNYKTAKNMITTNNKKVFQKVLLDIERIMEDFRGQLYSSLRDPHAKPDHLKKAIRVLMEIGNGKGEWAMIGDPCWYCLSNKHKAIITLIKQCHEDKSLPHHKRIQRLSILLLSNIPNLYKMGKAYVEGRFDIKDPDVSLKSNKQNQLLPTAKVKEAKSITVVVHYLDESFSSYSVTDDKKIKDLIAMCMKRFPDSASEYRMYKLSEKKGKGDSITRIKLVELEPDASPYKLYKKITDKKHKFLFKKITEEYSVSATSAMNEENFRKLVIDLLQLYSGKVEDLFFNDDLSAEDLSSDMTSNMVENVNEVIKCLEMLVGLGMPDSYLDAIRQLVESLTLHFVSRICSEMIGEVSFLYLLEDWAINDDAQNMIISANQVDGMVTTRLLDEFFNTIKSSLTQLSVLATNPALLKHVEKALCEAIESFGDCLHHLVFESNNGAIDKSKTDEDEEPVEQISETKKVLLSLSNCSTVVSKTAIQLRDYYVLLFHQPMSQRIKKVIEKLGVLEKMIFEKYVQEKNLEFSDLVSKGILYSGINWCSKNAPTKVSSFTMIILTKIVFIHNEVMKTINSIDVTSGIIMRIFEYLLVALQYNFEKLDPLYVSQCGQAQLLLDVAFIERVLSPYSNEKTTKLSTSIRRYITSMKKIPDDLIVRNTCEKSSLIFLCLNDSLKQK